MPYVLLKKNGKAVETAFVFTQHEVDNLSTDAKNCYTVVNVATHRTTTVGACKRKKRRKKYRR